MSDPNDNDNGPEKLNPQGLIPSENSFPKGQPVKKEQSDPQGVTWDSEDDELNPMNWTAGKKWGIVAVVSMMTFITLVYV